MQLHPEKLDPLVQSLADSLSGEIGVAFYDVQTGQEYLYNADEMMHAASTMKVPVMIEVFRQADAGQLSLDQPLLVKNEFKSIVDGSTYAMDISEDSADSLYRYLGKDVAIRELVRQMIVRSSNLATNLLIELVDAKNVTASMRALGADTIQVLRGVEDIKAYRKGWSNYTNARDMMVIMRALATGEAASTKACDEMISILTHQQFRKKIPAGVPDSVRVANKTGWITAISHDCAIVFPVERKPYILVVLTRGIANNDQASKAIAHISKEIYLQLIVSKNNKNS